MTPPMPRPRTLQWRTPTDSSRAQKTTTHLEGPKTLESDVILKNETLEERCPTLLLGVVFSFEFLDCLLFGKTISATNIPPAMVQEEIEDAYQEFRSKLVLLVSRREQFQTRSANPLHSSECLRLFCLCYSLFSLCFTAFLHGQGVGWALASFLLFGLSRPLYSVSMVGVAGKSPGPGYVHVLGCDLHGGNFMNALVRPVSGVRPLVPDPLNII